MADRKTTSESDLCYSSAHPSIRTCTIHSRSRNNVSLDTRKSKSLKSIIETRRLIRVDFYPKCLNCVIDMSEKHHKVTAGQIKERVMELLDMDGCNSVYFGLFSGTRYNPVFLYSDEEELPECTSQYVFRRLSFKMNEQGSLSRHDKRAEELISTEVMGQYASNTILPLPDADTRHVLNLHIERGSVDEFWKTLNSYSRCTVIEGIATCQIHLTKQVASLTEGVIATKIGLDLGGMYIFDVEGEMMIWSCPWTTVTNIRMHCRPTMLFMFDIVVQEKGTRFLRTIIIQNSSCEYLFSLAKHIFEIHELHPEVHEGIEMAKKGVPLPPKYHPQFQVRENIHQPYTLLKCIDKMPFKMYAHEGLSSVVLKDIEDRKAYYLRKSYPWPYGVYVPNQHISLPKLQQVELKFYQVYYYSHWTARNCCNFDHKVNFINVQVPSKSGIPVLVRDIKLAIGKSLHLDSGSLKYFALYLTNKLGQRIEMLQNSDIMPTDYEGLSFQVLIFNWSKEADEVQWNTLMGDETAANLVFWEIVAGHGGMIRDAETIWLKLVHDRSICKLLYALGAITDLYTVGNCILWRNLSHSVTKKKYGKNSCVIASTDAHGLHIWDPQSGCRIVSWRWHQILGLKRLNVPVSMLEFYIANKSSIFTRISFQTESAPFLYSITKVILNNSGRPCNPARLAAKNFNRLRSREMSDSAIGKQTKSHDNLKNDAIGSPEHCISFNRAQKLKEEEGEYEDCVQVKLKEGLGTYNSSKVDSELELAAMEDQSVQREIYQKKKEKYHKEEKHLKDSLIQPLQEQMFGVVNQVSDEVKVDKVIDAAKLKVEVLQANEEINSHGLTLYVEESHDEQKTFNARVKKERKRCANSKQEIHRLRQNRRARKVSSNFKVEPKQAKESETSKKTNECFKTPFEQKHDKNSHSVKAKTEKKATKCSYNKDTTHLQKIRKTVNHESSEIYQPTDSLEDRCCSTGRSRQESSQAYRDIVTPALLVVTNKEEIKEYLKEDHQRIPMEADLAHKTFVNFPGKEYIQQIKVNKCQYISRVFMNTGEEALEKHLNNLLQIRTATSAEEHSSEENTEHQNSEHGGESKAHNKEVYESEEYSEESSHCNEKHSEVVIPQDTMVGEDYRYYCSNKKVIEDGSLLPDLRDTISFCSLPLQDIQEPAPPHLVTVISLLSNISPWSSGKYFFRCFIHQKNNKDSIVAKQDLQ